MKFKTKIEDVLPTLLLGVFSLIWGIVMIAKDLVAIGINRTLQKTGFGGCLPILIGIVFLIVTYYSLSPYSRIREFFEKRRKKK
jgi:hypothetical protein